MSSPRRDRPSTMTPRSRVIPRPNRIILALRQATPGATKTLHSLWRNSRLLRFPRMSQSSRRIAVDTSVPKEISGSSEYSSPLILLISFSSKRLGRERSLVIGEGGFNPVTSNLVRPKSSPAQACQTSGCSSSVFEAGCAVVRSTAGKTERPGCRSISQNAAIPCNMAQDERASPRSANRTAILGR
jgi:hypothetical protein